MSAPTGSVPMHRIVRGALLALSLGAAACSEGGDPTPGPGVCEPRLPALGALPAPSAPMRSTPLALPVLGLGPVPERYNSEIWVHNGWAYTGTALRRGTVNGNLLRVWNVTGNTPVFVDSLAVGEAGQLGDLQVTDDGRYLVVATEVGRGSIIVYDLADPAKPREIARYATETTRPGVHTAEVSRVDGKLYAFLSVPGRSQVVVLSLATPASPQVASILQTGSPYTHDVFVRDGLLFTAGWETGTVVWDIGGGGCGSPENPVKVAAIPTQDGNVHNVWWFHDPRTGSKRYLLIGEEGPVSIGTSSIGDIHVVDLGSDWSAPKEVAFFRVPGAGTHNFWVDEPSGILYAGYYNGGLRALDIRGDLGTCTADQKDATGRCDLGRMGREVGRGLVGGSPVYVWGAQLVGSHLYVGDMLNGLWKLDASGLKR